MRTERCAGPLNRLVSWRDKLEVERIYQHKMIAPAELAVQERQQVEQTVEILKEERSCSSVWRVLLFQDPSNPALRLQEEAILRLLGESPHDYGKKAVGWAQVTTSGRPPVGE